MDLTFYDKDFDSCYEELLTYYPLFYREVYELQEILKAQGKQADNIEDGIERTYLNNFIDYMDEDTVKKMEAFMSLDGGGGKSLETRRGIIKSYIMGGEKLSATALKEMIGAYVDADIDIELRAIGEYIEPGETLLLDGKVNLDGARLLDSKGDIVNNVGDQALYITIQRTSEQEAHISDIEELLSRRLPAHLMYVITDIVIDE